MDKTKTVGDIDALGLEKENRRLKRQLRDVESQLKRNNAMLATYRNVNTMQGLERQKMERSMNLLLENCPDIILLFDREGRFTHSTNAFLHATGIAGFGLIRGSHFSDVFSRFVDGERLDGLVCKFRAAVEKKSVVILDDSLDFSGNGQPRHYTIHIAPLLDDAREVEGALMLFHDQTNIVRAKESAEYAREAAESANRAKSDFLATMSHEMRTPMNAIIGMTNIGKSSDTLERKNYCLDKIESASVHLLGVINDILDMSKIESGKFEMTEEEFFLEKALVAAGSVVSHRMDENNLTFDVHLDANIPGTIIADQQRFLQVLMNLLSNAVKFTPAGGKISLHIRKVAEGDGICTLRVEVADSGIGIPKKQQEQLFQSFVQADSSVSRRFGGTGLGLAISRKIVEMMGGAIWVESEEGKGSCFTFTMKAKVGAVTYREALCGDTDWRAARVLVVSKSLAVRNCFTELGTLLGFFCRVVSGDGVLANEEAFDVMFTDALDDLASVRRVRENANVRDVVVIASAARWSRVEEEARAIGIHRFVSPPLFYSSVAGAIKDAVITECPAAALPDGGYDGRFAGRRILLAEDIAINREIVCTLLESTGVHIDCARNGSEACAMFASAPGAYDMIFMDIHMPEMDGYKATQQIRASGLPSCGTIPILAMTANVFREDVEKCLAAGMNDHVGKPLAMDVVMEKMQRYLG